MESARAMLAARKLPHSLWGEAVLAAVYLLNMTINSRSGTKTPFELTTGRKPVVRLLESRTNKDVALCIAEARMNLLLCACVWPVASRVQKSPTCSLQREGVAGVPLTSHLRIFGAYS